MPRRSVSAHQSNLRHIVIGDVSLKHPRIYTNTEEGRGEALGELAGRRMGARFDSGELYLSRLYVDCAVCFFPSASVRDLMLI